MTRTRASAKAAGSRFERLIADYLAQHVDERIDRRVKTGSKDRGDVANLRTAHGHRLVIECKDRTRVDISGALTEVEIERGNDSAIAGIVAHKRHGKARPGDQLITMTLRDFVALMVGERPDDE